MSAAKNIWRIWAKALGQKASESVEESDKIAIIRTFIFLELLITHIFMIASIIRHW